MSDKTDIEKVTAPGSSVGADGEQSLSKNNYEKSIADLHVEGNLQVANCQKKTEQEDLQTVTMEELYDTAYPPKAPIVEGLVYAGTYLFVGAPKVGKSFFMAQLGYHVSRGIPLWDYPVCKEAYRRKADYYRHPAEGKGSQRG